MAVQYRFPCPTCQHVNQISTTQSGQELNCPACENAFEIPKLQIMRQLALVESELPEVTARSQSSISRVIFAFGLIVALLGMVAGLAAYFYARQISNDFEFVKGVDYINKQADDIDPVMLYKEWFFVEMQDDLGEWMESETVRYKTQGKIISFVAYGLLGVGALGFLIMGSSFMFQGTNKS